MANRVELLYFVFGTDDHSRVVLRQMGKAGSDYINANYVDVCTLGLECWK